MKDGTVLTRKQRQALRGYKTAAALDELADSFSAKQSIEAKLYRVTADTIRLLSNEISEDAWELFLNERIPPKLTLIPGGLS